MKTTLLKRMTLFVVLIAASGTFYQTELNAKKQQSGYYDEQGVYHDTGEHHRGFLGGVLAAPAVVVGGAVSVPERAVEGSDYDPCEHLIGNSTESGRERCRAQRRQQQQNNASQSQQERMRAPIEQGRYETQPIRQKPMRPQTTE